MAATYCNISQNEMAQFLESQGFKPMSIAGTIERVWGKRINHEDLMLSMRVYTGINPDGNSREVGKDAIRVELYWRDGEEVMRIGGTKRVNRVHNWRANLQSRINHWMEMLGPRCPKCNRPTVLREPSKGQKWQPFYGCVGFKRNHPDSCDGSVKSANFKPVSSSHKHQYDGEAEAMYIESQQH